MNPKIDLTFSFMTVDHDGKIRMDCSSPYAMARLVGLKDRYDVAFAKIQTPTGARHPYTVVRADESQLLPGRSHHYLLTHRPHWPDRAGVGKALVSSSMIDRVAERLGHRFMKCPSASNGSCLGCSTDRAALAVRKAPPRALGMCYRTPLGALRGAARVTVSPSLVSMISEMGPQTCME